MLKINIRSIPAHEQRYPTCGDYVGDPHTGLYVTVNEMGDCYKEFLVALHELCEYFSCRMQGIEEPKIAAFDIEFEKNRQEGDDSEPGDSLKAPYRIQHRFAENIERQMCLQLGIDWNDYSKTVEESENYEAENTNTGC